MVQVCILQEFESSINCGPHLQYCMDELKNQQHWHIHNLYSV